ncbi:MAG: TraR/DksA C4-type zinc finger protein [Candidatus Pacebacteria bacterium]|nr:TraR/DksA C4-type zinc finger protein [Candidatus Paceibacterota bacterium]
MTLSQEKIAELQTALQDEKTLLEKELASLGHLVNDKGDWAATPGEQPGSTGNDDADKNVQADYIEEFEGRIAESDVLEQRYAQVVSALVRIENGTYGVCEVSGEEIELDRLEANPAASTCKEHME